MERAGLAGDAAGWLLPVEEETLAALEELGPAAPGGGRQGLPALAQQIPLPGLGELMEAS